MNLSANFTLAEMCRSATAEEHGIDNTPPAFAIDNGRHLAVDLLQPVRDHFGAPIKVTSWFRAPPLNGRIGGALTSQHLTADAADIVVVGVPALTVARWIAASDLPFDQVIFEIRFDGRRWTHLSRALSPRREALAGIKYRGRPTKYLPLADYAGEVPA